MAHTDDTLQQWRERSAQLRAIADTMKDTVAKRLMGELAACYDQLAKRGEERTKK